VPAFFDRAPAVGFRFLLAHFEHQRRCDEVRFRQLCVSRLERCTSPDIDSSVEVSVRRLHACSASGATHSCKEWYNSRPVCHYSLVIVSSMKHLCSPISPHLHRQLLFFARRSHRRGCSPVSSDSQRCRSFRIPEFHAHTFPFYFYFFKKTQLFMPSDEDPPGRRRSSRRTTKCALVSPCGERFSAWRSGAITRFRHRNACSS